MITDDFRAKYQEWARTADAGEKAAVDGLLKRAHDQASAAASAISNLSPELQHRELAFAFSSIANAPAPIVERPMRAVATATAGLLAERGLPPIIERALTTKDGSIIGHGKFEALDPGWLRAATDWLDKRPHAPVLTGQAKELEIPAQVQLGIVGDWGTGYWESDSPAERVANALTALRADITIHLGDEYYSGRAEQESEFAARWPAGSQASFALNSNHAMYSGAQGFYEQTLTAPKFSAQNRTSYFCMYNKEWLVLALDSAISSSWIHMYMDGQLEPVQKAFIKAMRAKYPGRRVVVMSHHQPFDLDGSNSNTLWRDVESALGAPPAFWYFGHAHAAVAYRPVNGCQARCVGHGAVPFGVPSELYPALGKSIDWFESQNATDARVPERCFNGGLLLSLDGPALAETFFDENGRTRKHYRW